MSKQYHAFVAALDKLCEEHGVQLSTSTYGTIEVWTRQEWSIGGAVHQNNIDDETEPDPIP